MTRTLPKPFLAQPIAHRGLHGPAPENSLGAFRAAIAGGFGIELDVQLTRDRKAVVFHDYTLERLTREAGPVRMHDQYELGNFSLEGTEETIPTLPETLGLVAGQVPIIIEIKDQDMHLGPDIGPLERAVAKDIRRYPGDLALMSFNPHTVHMMKELCPGTACGLITCDFPEEHWGRIDSKRLAELRSYDSVNACNADFISHVVNDLDSGLVAQARADGLPVLCWTVRSVEDARHAYRLADQITFEGFTPA
ncbi:glycerophosphodiester phosphodiesterase family protein [Qingshengfaniella alkalisoli]|uniref:Phosphodiesterase n=1 Tax=Qingshengfaniella alkalisoli TaxID=2599296 RepID=A0A5B8J647_9RHOB|nr:glycerophosphodiester phosphodiesterase family protein [Qingshengfaniella alkalisoli]QDY69907.1 phosphodiesterase [Qingshengfaniella alkalisoli]